MSMKHAGLATILTLAISLPAMAQSDQTEVTPPKPKAPPAAKPAGISILELDDGEELTFTVPVPAPTNNRNTKSAVQRGIPANSIPARLSSFTQTTAPEQEGGELIRQRFPNGAVQVERWVKEDGKGNIVNHGSFTEFAANGSIIASGNYHMGLREATWNKQITVEQAKKLVPNLDKGFAPPFTSQADFRNGKLHGDWILTDSKGNMVFTWGMDEGQRHGSSTFYSPKGEVTQSITYDKNVAHGPAKLLAERGTAAESQELVRGMILRRVDKWYPVAPGSKAAPVLQSQEWQLTSANLNVNSHDWENDSVSLQVGGLVPPPVRHGLAITFYPNGQRESEGNYDNGKKSGAFAWWYANGQQKTVGEYREDAEHAEWTWWHENGMKQAAGKFVEGQRIEEWSVWNAEGALVKRTQADSSQQVAERNDEKAPNVVR